MKVQINPTQTQEIKSFKTVRFINKQDLEYQLSIVKLGMKYNRYQQMIARTVRDYNKLNKQMEVLSNLDVKIYRLLERFDFNKQESRTLDYSIK